MKRIPPQRPRCGWALGLCAALAATTILSGGRAVAAQLDAGAVTGAYYRVRPTLSASRTFNSVEVDRLAPASLAAPPPVGPVSLNVPLLALTGQIFELPERLRIYFVGIDRVGAVRLFELDFFSREVSLVLPPSNRAAPTAVTMQASPDLNKFYVQWWSPGAFLETDIYDSESLNWLGSTLNFRPDERAWGFEHAAPYMWTLGAADELQLVDTQTDGIAVVVDPQHWLGPVQAVAADAWRDLVLFRVAASGDRYLVVDIGSGEVGPSLDLPNFGRHVARLEFGGRLLVLLSYERGPPSLYSRRRTPVATGDGVIYDLRQGLRRDEFHLVVPPDFPVAAVGTSADNVAPGRLWVFANGDDQRFDLDIAECRGPVPGGGDIEARIDVSWNPTEARRYGYTVRVAAASEAAAGAVAVESDRGVENAFAPPGWGIDLIQRERWVRWTNGLGPADEDVAPGASAGRFDLLAQPETRPRIAEYRIQAAVGQPRGCESDEVFLKNAISGYTIAPERVTTDDPKRLALRLERLVDRACVIGWIEQPDCEPLLDAAKEAVRRKDRSPALDQFYAGLDASALSGSIAFMLSDAAAAVQATLRPVN